MFKHLLSFIFPSKFYKNRKILFVRIIQSSTETFRCEKSARNNSVSSTRNYWE